MLHVPLVVATVEAMKAVPGAGVVTMTLREMALAFGVPWHEVQARLSGPRLTSHADRGGMADGADVIHAVPARRTRHPETQKPR